MRQSSGAQKADKRLPKRRRLDAAARPAVAGVAGTALLGACIWLARAELARMSTPALLSVLGVAVGGAVALAALVVASLAERSSGDTARSVVAALDAVAQGDLTAEPATNERSGALAGVARATARAVAAIRGTLAGLRTHARETESRAQELAVQIAAMQSAGQRTTESASLANQGAIAFGASLRAVHPDLVRAHETALALAREQRATSERDARLRELTGLASTELRDGATTLEAVRAHLDRTSPELDALSAASEEIGGFVVLVRKMARQSKLLALNAAMEAARAGEQGSGFAVVAGEVRRLARSSAEAAERTDALVKEVLLRAARVREATADGERGFARMTDVAGRAASVMEDADRLLAAAALPNADRDDALAGLAPLTGELAARVARLTYEADALAAAVRDTHLATGAQLARTQDSASAAQTLTRVAARVAAGTSGLRLERLEHVPPPGPAATAQDPGDGSAPRASHHARLATA